ncbi:MAG: hypothetical protein P8Y03_30340 [Anaerolineales bacterium]|jgi:hypothetical protein
MNRLSRPTALKIAAVLSFLLSASGVIFSLPLIAQGATAVEQGGETPPYFILLVALIVGVVGVVAAFGAWKGQRWGIILTIFANVVNGLSAAPGMLFAPTPGLLIAASVTVVLGIAIIVLCLWPDRKLATA